MIMGMRRTPIHEAFRFCGLPTGTEFLMDEFENDGFIVDNDAAEKQHHHNDSRKKKLKWKRRPIPISQFPAPPNLTAITALSLTFPCEENEEISFSGWRKY